MEAAESARSPACAADLTPGVEPGAAAATARLDCPPAVATEA
ncbi:MAG: hypothetical protein JWM74_4414, partial [Myxococcaceae bacterium]|nr:hypothetical protein [Myxococcaceae bacterium]